MTKFTDTVNEVLEDLSDPLLNKEHFLAECACQRIKSRNQKYEESFDKYLSLIEKNEGSISDLVRTGKTLISLSKLITSSYEGLIKMISSYEKNLFHKSD